MVQATKNPPDGGFVLSAAFLFLLAQLLKLLIFGPFTRAKRSEQLCHRLGLPVFHRVASAGGLGRRAGSRGNGPRRRKDGVRLLRSLAHCIVLSIPNIRIWRAESGYAPGTGTRQGV